jgi:hypothetical protein
MSTTENPYGNDALGPANAPGSRDSFTLTAMIVYTGSNVVRCCLFDHFGIARAGGDGQRPVQAGRGRGGAGKAGERVECLTALPGCRAVADALAVASGDHATGRRCVRVCNILLIAVGAGRGGEAGARVDRAPVCASV